MQLGTRAALRFGWSRNQTQRFLTTLLRLQDTNERPGMTARLTNGGGLQWGYCPGKCWIAPPLPLRGRAEGTRHHYSSTGEERGALLGRTSAASSPRTMRPPTFPVATTGRSCRGWASCPRFIARPQPYAGKGVARICLRPQRFETALIRRHQPLTVREAGSPATCPGQGGDPSRSSAVMEFALQ